MTSVLPWQAAALALHRSPGRGALRRLARNRPALAGGIVVVTLGAIALLAPLITPYDYARQDYDAILRGPSLSHWFGTDALGRDVLSRAIFGARTSLAVGVVAQAIVVGLGLAVGVLASVGGRAVDNLLMRLTDVAYAFPDLLLIILLRAIFGGSLLMIMLAIALVNWTTVARLARGQILSLRQQDFALAARSLGAHEPRVVLRHLLPNALGPIIVVAAFGVPRAIFAEAALSFIGIGVAPPTPSWGSMVQDGYQAIFAFPHLVLFPTLAIALVMMAFTFLGDGLRDALDPRQA
jgi:oligopeptide transport system permease protein